MKKQVLTWIQHEKRVAIWVEYEKVLTWIQHEKNSPDR